MNCRHFDQYAAASSSSSAIQQSPPPPQSSDDRITLILWIRMRTSLRTNSSTYKAHSSGNNWHLNSVYTECPDEVQSRFDK